MRNIFRLTALLFLTIANVCAQNTITIPEIIGKRATTVDMSVAVQNVQEVYGIQFDVTLPDGCALETSTTTKSARCNDHEATLRKMSDNTYRLILFSPTNKALNGYMGDVISLRLSIPDEIEEDVTKPVTISNAVLAGASGANVLTGTESLGLTVRSCPDLAPSAVTVSSTILSPGGHCSVSWIVENLGATPTDAGWKEKIYLTDGTVSTQIASISYDQVIGGKAQVARQAEVTLPDILRLDGNVNIKVQVEPLAQTGEPTSYLYNNTSLSTESITLGKKLYLTLPATVNEANNTAIQCRLQRSGKDAVAETFTLQSSDARVFIPESVTIAAGQTSEFFYITPLSNGVLDDAESATVSAVGNGYDIIKGEFTVKDDTQPRLTVTVDKNDLKEGDNFVLTITAERAPKADLSIQLTCDGASRFSLNSPVTLNAGETMVTVPVNVVDDEAPDMTVSYSFTASAMGYVSGQTLVTVNDDDVPAISLTITPAILTESAGRVAATAVLKRTGVTTNRVIIRLSDNSGGRIYLQPYTQLIMEKGVEEIQFPIGVNDNDLVDGNGEYIVTAAVYISSCSCSVGGESRGYVTAPLSITDDDGPCIKITSSRATLLEGSSEATVLTVTRNTPTVDDLYVTLSSDREERLSYIHTVLIPAGSRSETVTVAALSNDEEGDTQTVMFTATADGHSKGICYATISDQTLPDAHISEISLSAEDITAGADVDVTVTVTNDGAANLMAQTPVKVYLSSNQSNPVILFTSRVLAVGESETLQTTLNTSSVIGRYSVWAIVNETHSTKEISYNNNNSETKYLRTRPRFEATLAVDKALYNKGENVNINGSLTGDFVEGDKVEVYVMQGRSRQTISAQCDGEGHFSAIFTPYSGNSGHFIAGACYPTSGLADPQAEFDILAMLLASSANPTHEIKIGTDLVTSVQIKNPCSVPLTGINIDAEFGMSDCSVEIGNVSNIQAGGTVTIPMTIHPIQPSEGTDWKELSITVTSNEGPSLNTVIYYFVSAERGVLKASVPSINTKMVKGASRSYEFTVTNHGGGETGAIALDLPEWMGAYSAINMASLAAGESATVILRLTPTENMSLNMAVTGTIVLHCAACDDLSIPYRIEPVSETTGVLDVDVCDQFTYETQEKPHVAGADVSVLHPTTGAVIASGQTGADGHFTAEIPEGYYRLNVTADKHESYSEYILIEPGETNEMLLNLDYNAIVINYDMEETEVPDEYKIVTHVTYEVSVPKPVVIISLPERFEGDDMQVGDKRIFYATITNKGMMTAFNNRIILPEDGDGWAFRALEYTEPFDLPAQQSVTVPVEVTCLDPDIVPTGQHRTMASDFKGCMAGMEDLYEALCGTELKQNAAAERMAMKLCGAAASSKAIMDMLAAVYEKFPVFGGGGGSGKPAKRTDEKNKSKREDPDGKNNPPTVGKTMNICDPCDAKRMEDMVNFLLDKTYLAPINDALQTAAEGAQTYRQSGSEGVRKTMTKREFERFRETLSSLATNAMGPAGGVIETISDVHEFTQAIGGDCPEKNAGNARAVIQHRAAERTWQTDLKDAALNYTEWLKSVENIYTEILGDEVWTKGNLEGKMAFFTFIISHENVTAEEALAVRPEGVTEDQVINLIERYNGTSSSNVVDMNRIEDLVAQAQAIDAQATGSGYESMTDMFFDKYEVAKTKYEEMTSSNVCASITLQFSQSMTMTRQAFRGTLTIYNGHETDAMTDVKLNLIVTNAETGDVATEQQFAVTPESLKGFSGTLSLDEGWTLDAGKTGVSTIIFLPNRDAAPVLPTAYTFAGSVSYIDPYTSLEVTRRLAPVTLTVKPSPNLELHYFMQRDVYGDDPHTGVVEKSVPAEFALNIINSGYGDANDVTMTTNQPEIIDNEKGVPLQMEIISTTLNGKETSMVMGTAENYFGDIPAHSTAYAQWWIKSNLLGHFTNYDVTVTRVGMYGNEYSSLIDTENTFVKELIRSVHTKDVATNEMQTVWLVNDLPDADNLPDVAYVSNGDVKTISPASEIIAEQLSETQYRLRVTPLHSGWNYAKMTDPVFGRRSVVSIIRESDGAEISARNVWQTDRTLRDGAEPLYEYKLHFADYFAENAEDSYIVTFSEVAAVTLAVESIGGRPEEGTATEEPVETVIVTFNKPIVPSSFTSDDITYSIQGTPQDCSQIIITAAGNDTDFTLDLSPLSSQNGYHVLVIQTADITDKEGFLGKDGMQASWIYTYNPTGVDEIRQDSTSDESVPIVYTLDGRRVKKAYRRGLYIVNGNKQFVK